MSTKTCATCKHWWPNAHPEDVEPGEDIHAEGRKWGCDNASVRELVDDDFSNICTRGNFGCIFQEGASE